MHRCMHLGRLKILLSRGSVTLSLQLLYLFFQSLILFFHCADCSGLSAGLSRVGAVSGNMSLLMAVVALGWSLRALSLFGGVNLHWLSCSSIDPPMICWWGMGVVGFVSQGCRGLSRLLLGCRGPKTSHCSLSLFSSSVELVQRNCFLFPFFVLGREGVD